MYLRSCTLFSRFQKFMYGKRKEGKKKERKNTVTLIIINSIPLLPIEIIFCSYCNNFVYLYFLVHCINFWNLNPAIIIVSCLWKQIHANVLMVFRLYELSDQHHQIWIIALLHGWNLYHTIQKITSFHFSLGISDNENSQKQCAEE